MAEARWGDAYLSQTPVNQWDILDYLSRVGDLEQLPFDKLLSSWVKALAVIIDDGESPDEKKRKAEKLSERYKSSAGADDTRARDWYKNRGGAPPVIITNSFTDSSRCSVNLSLPGSSDGDRRPLKRRSSSNRGVKLKKKQKKPNGKATQSDDKLHERFTNSYNTMKDESKWRLPGGKFLEDILYEHFKKESQEHSAHSWVIDLDDSAVKSCFNNLEWSHISEQMPQWPDSDSFMGQSLMRFEEVQTASDLSAVLEKTSYFQGYDEDEALDDESKRQKYLGPRWIDVVMRQLLPLYEDPAHFKSKYNLENWFVVNIWSAFLDQSMMTLKDIHLSRGESQSMSSSDRKNADPVKSGSRKKTGRRYDGVLRFNDIEIGAVEHARGYQGETGRKWREDTLKLAKVLHDMLTRVEPLVDSEEAFKSLQVVGLVTAGLHCQPMRMKYAKGYMCILCRHQRREVPTTLEDAGDLFALLLDFWGIRTLVQDCKGVLETLKSDKRKQFFQRLKSSSALPPRVPLLIPSFDTDGTTDDDDET